MKQPTKDELLAISYWEYLKTFSITELLVYCDDHRNTYQDVNNYHGKVRDKLSEYDNEFIISIDHEQLMRQFLFLNYIAERRIENPNFLSNKNFLSEEAEIIAT